MAHDTGPTTADAPPGAPGPTSPGYLPAPMPPDEAERLAALQATGLLDTPAAQIYDRITASVAELLQVPIALISLVDHDRQWFLSRHGLAVSQTPRDVSFCGHVVAARDSLAVSDALADPRFAGNPLVTGEPRVRAYAAAPVFDGDGRALGTICAIDHRPRAFSDEQRRVLERYARALERLIGG